MGILAALTLTPQLSSAPRLRLLPPRHGYPFPASHSSQQREEKSRREKAFLQNHGPIRFPFVHHNNGRSELVGGRGSGIGKLRDRASSVYQWWFVLFGKGFSLNEPPRRRTDGRADGRTALESVHRHRQAALDSARRGSGSYCDGLPSSRMLEIRRSGGFSFCPPPPPCSAVGFSF